MHASTGDGSGKDVQPKAYTQSPKDPGGRVPADLSKTESRAYFFSARVQVLSMQEALELTLTPKNTPAVEGHMMSGNHSKQPWVS